MSVLAALCVLAVGIGTSAMVLSTIYSVTLRSLPGARGDKLVIARWSSPGALPREAAETVLGYRDENGAAGFSRATYDELVARGTFDETIGYAPFGYGIDNAVATIEERRVPVSAASASRNFFRALGVRMEIGTDLSGADDRTVVASFRFWQRHLGGRQSAVGSSIDINGSPYHIVGVASQAFLGFEPGVPTDLWVPLGNILDSRKGITAWGAPGGWLTDPSRWCLLIAGRLPAGKSLDAARAEVEAAAIGSSRGGLNPTTFRVALQQGRSGLSNLRQSVLPALLALLCVASIVLLLAWSAAASLWHDRFVASERDLTVKLALGSPVSEVVIVAVLEVAVFVAVSFVLSGLVAFVVSRFDLPLLTMAFRAEGLEIPEPPLAATMLAMAPAVAFTTVAVLAAAQVRRCRRLNAANLGRLDIVSHYGDLGFLPVRFGIPLLLQSAMSTLLVGLLFSVAWGYFQTVAKTDSLDLKRRAFIQLRAQSGGMLGPGVLDQLLQLREDIEAAPGVVATSLSTNPPLRGGQMWAQTTSAAGGAVNVALSFVAQNYFRSFGVPLTIGREFQSSDGAKSERVAIINDSALRLLEPDGNVIGRVLMVPPLGQVSIVGVAQDAYVVTSATGREPTVYLPLLQAPLMGGLPALTMAVQFSSDASDLLQTVTSKTRLSCRGCVATSATTGSDALRITLGKEYAMATTAVYATTIATVIALLAVINACALDVKRRSREVAIRMAIGASESRVATTVAARLLSVVAVGTVAGCLAALWIAGLLRHHVFALAEDSLVLLVSVSAALFLMTAIPAVAASFVSIRRVRVWHRLRASD